MWIANKRTDEPALLQVVLWSCLGTLNAQIRQNGSLFFPWPRLGEGQLGTTLPVLERLRQQSHCVGP